MGKIPFETTYSYSGEYYSPGILINLLKEKYSKMDSTTSWILLPIRALLFGFCFLVSLVIYPFYLITKLFFMLNNIDSSLMMILMWMVNIFYLISYYAYKILAGVHSVFCFIYCMIPPETYVLQKKAVVKRDSFYY